MRFRIYLYGLLPQDGDPETPTYPVGLRSKEVDCESPEEAVSLGIEWGKEILPPLGETLTDVELETTSPKTGKLVSYKYSLNRKKLVKM